MLGLFCLKTLVKNEEMCYTYNIKYETLKIARK